MANSVYPDDESDLGLQFLPAWQTVRSWSHSSNCVDPDLTALKEHSVSDLGLDCPDLSVQNLWWLCPPPPNRRGGRTYCFWCGSVGVASCLHSISWINGWILTKFAQTHYWDREKKWLDFGDLDLISRSHRHFKIFKFWPQKACLHSFSWTKWRILVRLHIYCNVGIV